MCSLKISKQNNFSGKDKNEFYTNCLNFYTECSLQIYKRFPLNSPQIKLLKSLSFIEPTNIPNIVSIASSIVSSFEKLNININDIDREWRLLRNFDIDFNLNVMNFWSTVRKIKDGNNCAMFPLINPLVLYILTFPHSSACVERLFSSINLNKTKSRNCLSTETLSGILHSKSKINNQQKSCYNFNISADMLKKHNSQIYWFFYMQL